VPVGVGMSVGGSNDGKKMASDTIFHSATIVLYAPTHRVIRIAVTCEKPSWLVTRASTGKAVLGGQLSSGTEGVPSDHRLSGIRNTVERSSGCSIPRIGEAGKPAPQDFGSVSGVKNIRCGRQGPTR
jgi:hypothetical protein